MYLLDQPSSLHKHDQSWKEEKGGVVNWCFENFQKKKKKKNNQLRARPENNDTKAKGLAKGKKKEKKQQHTHDSLTTS